MKFVSCMLVEGNQESQVRGSSVPNELSMMWNHQLIEFIQDGIMAHCKDCDSVDGQWLPGPCPAGLPRRFHVDLFHWESD